MTTSYESTLHLMNKAKRREYISNKNKSIKESRENLLKTHYKDMPELLTKCKVTISNGYSLVGLNEHEIVTIANALKRMKVDSPILS